MRSPAVLALVLAVFTACALAWNKEDHEIFRLRDEVAKAEGNNVTFYDLLGVSPGASQDQLTKAYRKKSRELHPDKARQAFVANYAKTGKSKAPSKKEIDAHVKKVTRSYQRLSVVANILKGAERDRYDHFLRNGFPAWRGSGYYYERFRPGLGSVFVGLLLVFGGGFHYFALLMGWRRRKDFVERYIRQARKTAWGDETAIPGIPGIDTPSAGGAQLLDDSPNDTPDESGQELVPRNRREKRAMEKEDKRKGKKVISTRKPRSHDNASKEPERLSSPQGAKKRIVAENGKILIVDSVGNVFLEEETSEGTRGEFLLDPEEEPKPTIFDTLLFKLPKFAFNQTAGRIFSKQTRIDESLLPSSDLPEAETALQNATALNLNAEARKRQAIARKAK